MTAHYLSYFLHACKHNLNPKLQASHNYGTKNTSRDHSPASIRGTVHNTGEQSTHRKSHLACALLRLPHNVLHIGRIAEATGWRIRSHNVSSCKYIEHKTLLCDQFSKKRFMGNMASSEATATTESSLSFLLRSTNKTQALVPTWNEHFLTQTI